MSKLINKQTLHKEMAEFNQHYEDIKERLNDIRLKSPTQSINPIVYDYINMMCNVMLDMNNILKDMKDKQDLLLNTMIKD